MPKPGDRDEPDMLPAATQALPAQPPEGAAEEVRAGDAAAPSLDGTRLTGNGSNELDPVAEPVVQPKPVEKAKPVEKPQPKPQRDKASEQIAAATEVPPEKPAQEENLHQPEKPTLCSWAR